MAKENQKVAPGAWEVLGMIGGALPGVSALSRGVARSTVQRLLGFWMMWHMYGGREGIFAAGVMAHSTYYRQEAEFRVVFGEDVADWAVGLSAAMKEAGREQD